MKRRKLLGLLAMVGCLLLTGCPPKGPADGGTSTTGGPSGEAKVVKIGAIVPLTGFLASYGESHRNGLELGVEDANESLKAANRPWQLAVTFEDTASETKNAVSAAQKLIADGVDVIAVSLSGPARAVVPVATAAGKPVLAITLDPTIQDTSPLVYRLYYGSDEEAKTLASYFGENPLPAGSKVGLLHADVPGIVQQVKEFTVPGLKQHGVSLALNEPVPPGTKDYKSYVTKLKAAQITHLIAIIYAEDYPGLLRDMHALDVETQLLGNWDQAYAEGLAEADREGFVAAVPSYVIGDQERIRSYAKRLRSKSANANLKDSPFAYDAARLVEAGVGEAPIADALAKVETYTSIVGEGKVLPSGAIVVPMQVARFTRDRYQAIELGQTVEAGKTAP